MINIETQVKLDAGDPELYSMMIKSQRHELLTQEMKLNHWLPLLQRFLSVTVTPLLERTEVQDLDPVSLIEAPFTWTLAHHLFGVDIRKANTTSAESLIELLSLLELTLDGSESRLRSRFTSSIWQQRKLRKLYRQAGSLQKSFSHLPSEVGLELLHAVLEWKRQVTDTLTWLFIYLEHQPGIANQIFVELSEHLTSRAYEPDDIFSLPTLHKMILETLRVAPPHWVTRWGEASTLISEDVFCQHFSLLPPHTQLVSSPLSFLPHRFLAAAHGAPLPSSYLPLGPGQIGRERLSFVLHTIAAISASLFRRGHIQVSRSEDELVKSLPVGEAGVFVEKETGATYGRPQMKIRFHVDERYIHIPSARV